MSVSTLSFQRQYNMRLCELKYKVLYKEDTPAECLSKYSLDGERTPRVMKRAVNYLMQYYDKKWNK